MSNTELKRQRMENYFVNAACEIIRDKGMREATIRNVSEKAGYNSATLYSYFKSFSHLIAYASFQFEREMLTAVENKMAQMKENDLVQIWPQVYIEMANFLLDNPNIFECNFVALYEGLTRDEVVELRDENSAFACFVRENLNRIAVQSKLNITEVERISQCCLSLIIGAVLLSIKQRAVSNKELLLSELNVQLGYIIDANLKRTQV